MIKHGSLIKIKDDRQHLSLLDNIYSICRLVNSNLSSTIRFQ